MKFLESKFQLNIKKNFLTGRTIQWQNQLMMVASPSQDMFSQMIDGHPRDALKCTPAPDKELVNGSDGFFQVHNSEFSGTS